MTQRTLVLQVAPALAPEIERQLQARAFSFHSAPYALFSARGEGVVATHYRSGKFVIQGASPERFAASFLDIDALARVPQDGALEGGARQEQREELVVGSDESGKGDYFGPLVVAAVRLDPVLSKALARGEVRDCKLMQDGVVLRVGAALRASVPHAIARLDPPAYNTEHARVKNLNPMLAALHARAIGELSAPGMHVIVDQFGNASLLEKALAHLHVELEQRHRAEELLVVAAASVIAREVFLTALRELSDTWAVDLAKGAGPPVDRSAREFVRLHGREQLGNVAKLHFKNSNRVPGGVR